MAWRAGLLVALLLSGCGTRSTPLGDGGLDSQPGDGAVDAPIKKDGPQDGPMVSDDPVQDLPWWGETMPPPDGPWWPDGPWSPDGPWKKDGPWWTDGPWNPDGPWKKDAPWWPDQFVWPDLAKLPDAFIWPLTDGGPICPPQPGVIGKVCASAATCGPGGFCLAVFGTAGVCTRTCIPDDPYTPLINEDNCPSGSQCGELSTSGSTKQNLCFRKCAPKYGCGDCDYGVACHPSSGWYVGLEKQGVCLFAGCKSNNDCPVTTGIACDTKQQNCPSGQFCTPVSSATTTTQGICAKPGLCDVLSGLCTAHSLGKPTAKVGDPCTGDVDCAGTMTCLYETDEGKLLKKGGSSCKQNSECCSGTCLYGTCTAGVCDVRYRNGYCTIQGCSFKTLANRACPAGSTCNHIYGGGLCQKTCTLSVAGSCRGNPTDLWGDYECRDWSKIAWPAGAPAAGGPVCDFGYAVPCTTWWTSTLDCSVLGDQTNSTNMACRDYQGTVLTNKYSPDGRCFDDTASGTKKR
jgi:hypothetical protein